jgi:hypothetical protein
MALGLKKETGPTWPGPEDKAYKKWSRPLSIRVEEGRQEGQKKLL